MKILSALLVSALVLISNFAFATIDLDKLEQDMKSTGVTGWIHAVVADRNIAVFTYRNPNDFFDYVILPATSSDTTVYADLLKYKRNQQVKIYGKFVTNGAPVKHLDISKIELVKDYVSDLDQKPHVYVAKDADYKNMTTLTGRVHAIDQGGQVLVIEYKDLVTPVFVENQPDIDIVKNLYRGDKINLNYVVRAYPGSPVHLSPKPVEATKPAIEVVEKIKDMDGKQVTKDGYLVRFEKSPEIAFDVYAVLAEDSEGTNIQFTIVNFDNADLFTKVRAKLAALWTSNTTKIENGRNKLINRGVRVRVSGTGNVQDPSQANAQILVNSLDDIKAL